VITITVEGAKGSGKTTFINNILIPALHMNGQRTFVEYDERRRHAFDESEIDFLIVEKL
jgi:molybdopterin-guanine dinucleotide biosynthesis protein